MFMALQNPKMFHWKRRKQNKTSDSQTWSSFLLGKKKKTVAQDQKNESKKELLHNSKQISWIGFCGRINS